MSPLEWAGACRLAFDRDTDLSSVSDEPLHGCGLPGFKPVQVTMQQVAKLIRWQCCYIFGPGHDAEALEETRRLLVTLRRATILDSKETDYKLIMAISARRLLGEVNCDG